MRTASWSTYFGPGRIALSPPPAGTPRGYRIGPAALFLRAPTTSAAIRARLADLDPHAVAAGLHALVYPAEPVLAGSAAPGAGSYRDMVGRWLAFHGHPVTELDPEAHRPRKVKPTAVVGLLALLATSPAGAATLDTITDPSTGCVYVTTGTGLSARLRRDGLPDCPGAGRIEHGGSDGVQDGTVRDLTRSVDHLQSEVQTLRREVENARRELERRR